MSVDESEWVRLPGLFRWDEVCEVFAVEAGLDRDWRFLVQLAPESSSMDLLYVVHAARAVATRRAPSRRGTAQHDACESEEPAD